MSTLPDDPDTLELTFDIDAFDEVHNDDPEAPEGDLLEQAHFAAVEEATIGPSRDAEAPAADALEQARLVNRDGREDD